MKTKNLFSIAFIFSIISSPIVTAQDWPQYLGSNRNSTSSQKGILKSWPDSGPEVLWSVGIGRGYGGPVIKDGKIYLLDRDDEVGDIMRCFELRTGKELWRFEYDAPGELPFPGSRSVPIVDERHVYSCGPNGDLYCIDLNTHKPVWKKNIWTDFGGESLPTWGISQCPIIYGDLLIVASQASETGVVAFDKETGAVVWKTPNLGNVSYTSPSVVKIDGEDHVVMVSSAANRAADGNVTGLNPLTGDILWQYSKWNTSTQVPSAVDAGENRLLIIGELGSTMIKVNKTAGNAFEITELFSTSEFGDEIKPAVLHNGYFYAMYRTVAKRDGLVCMNMDGEIMWKTKRNPDFAWGSMIVADGLFLATDGMSTLYLIEPDPTMFNPIAKAPILREGGASTEGMARIGGSTQNFAPMALADGKLLIRDQSRMLCVKIIK